MLETGTKLSEVIRSKMRVNLLNWKCSILISNFARLDNKLSKFEEFCFARKVVAI